MKKIDKVNNSSKYWADFEGDLCVYFHLKWIGEHSINKFISNEIDFFKKYVSLTYKYGFAIPLNCNEINLLDLYQNEKIKNKDHGKSGWYFMFHLYKFKDTLVYPSKLFTDVNDKISKNIIKIAPFIELKNIETADIGYRPTPSIRIELREKGNEITLTCYLDNDIFNLELDNKKTKYEFEYPVDNSELAYLNTPRLNSFLRDLKKLCFEYGANDFEFENLGLQDFSENGVLFDGEIIYYEDIVGLLMPHQKIVK